MVRIWEVINIRLIDADELLKHIPYEETCSRFAVENAPTIEPNRKKGKWIDGHCSNCGCDIPAYIIDWKWQKDMDAHFCPNCGADMRNR